MPRVRAWHRNVTANLHGITHHFNPQGQGNAEKDRLWKTNQPTKTKQNKTKPVVAIIVNIWVHSYYSFLIYRIRWLNVFASEHERAVPCCRQLRSSSPICFILIRDVNASPGCIAKEDMTGSDFLLLIKRLIVKLIFSINTQWQSFCWDMLTDVSWHLQN